jgi:hypothetical protein
MGKTVHSVKLIPYDSASLAQVSYSNGDVVYDNTNKTLRVMDGLNPGGRQLLKNDLSNIATSGGTVNFGASTITSAGFIGQISDLSNHSITDLSDVDTTGTAAGQILGYNGTNWVPTSLSGNFNGGTIAADLISTSLTNSTSGTTGSFNTLGGIGITKDLFVGGDVAVEGKISSVGDIVAKNRGVVTLNNTANTASVSLTVAANLTTSATFILPGIYGTVGQVLATNGAGVLSWVTPSGGGAGGGSAGGPAKSIQYNNGLGGFDGQATFTYDNATDIVSATRFSGLLTSANITIPGASGGGLISSTGYNYLSTIGSLIIDGDQVALDYRGNNNLFVNQFGVEFYTNTTGTSGFNASISANNYWAFAPDGTTYLPGNITMPTGTVTASAVTTTNDVTVGANVNISTVPTLPIHATNKSYVDTRALALAVAMS